MSDINKPAQPKRYDSHTQAFQIDHKDCIPRRGVERLIEEEKMALSLYVMPGQEAQVNLVIKIIDRLEKLLENNG